MWWEHASQVLFREKVFHRVLIDMLLVITASFGGAVSRQTEALLPEGTRDTLF